MPDYNAQHTRSGVSIVYWLSLSVVVVLIDQITKLWVGHGFGYGESKAVTDFFNLVLVYNSGAAFSFLSDAGGWQRWLLSAVAVAASVWIIWLLSRHAHQRLFSCALALILGGALGNLVDRVMYGYVVDFLDFYWGAHHFPAFNVADSAVSCGAALLLWDGFTKKI
ncbi:MAG: lipoprotein signal peptidase [Candidatus Nitrotoga sp.]|jgi:signal peptidase II|nr:lipoprotein signal peptidase [Candidatus Nitrotoga sp.]MBA0902069.1 lipoprotein signal peptidase [Candidatus Nitrotoga sp.]MBP0118761.1 lipoprotein signal peptidase [Candidatus Nitrotoga sp.]MBP0126419.1 lipoprotein signal peptidase [Candidatus Nitrotoga sp.]